MDMVINQHSMLRHYGLDLQSCYLSTPVRKRQLQNIPGADGQEDLMKGMGPPCYESRSLRATFRLTSPDSHGVIDRITADLEGQTLPFVLPGDPDHYMIGDFHVVSAAPVSGGQVVISATCQPWRYFREETTHDIPYTEEDAQYKWFNLGRRGAVLKLHATGEIILTEGGMESTYPPGEYLLPDLLIPACDYLTVTIRGGPGIVSYKEAIL